MRILLTILLFLTAAATFASTMTILNIPTAPLALKIVPVGYAVAAIISAIMVIRRSSKAFIPYTIGFALFLATIISQDGLAGIPKGVIGFVIVALFFIPSVRNSPPTAPTDEPRNA